MELTIKERLTLPTLMPSKGKFEDLVCAEEITAKVKFTRQEMDDNGIKTSEDGKGLSWEDEVKTFSYSFSELEVALMKRILMETAGKGELQRDHLNLYRMFVNNTDSQQPVAA